MTQNTTKLARPIASATGSTSVRVWEPYALALDSVGKLYIADSGNNAIRLFSGATLSTVAGNGNGGFSGDGGGSSRPCRERSAGARHSAAGSGGETLSRGIGSARAFRGPAGE